MLFKKDIRLCLLSSLTSSFPCLATVIKKLLVERRRHIMTVFHPAVTLCLYPLGLKAEKACIKNWA